VIVVDSLFNVILHFSVPLLVVSWFLDRLVWILTFLPGWIVSTDYPIKLHLDLIFSCVHVMTYTSKYISWKLEVAFKIYLAQKTLPSKFEYDFPKET